VKLNSFEASNLLARDPEGSKMIPILADMKMILPLQNEPPKPPKPSIPR
jgi:hypothetical protein